MSRNFKLTSILSLFFAQFIFLCFFTGITSGSNQHQQAAEENRQAIVLFAIVVLFFICHLFRNFLSLHEALTFEQKKQDYFHGCGGMPFGILIVGLVSHLLLTCNSAFNFFLYCAMSEQFRTELKKVLGFKSGVDAPAPVENGAQLRRPNPTQNGGGGGEPTKQTAVLTTEL